MKRSIWILVSLALILAAGCRQKADVSSAAESEAETTRETAKETVESAAATAREESGEQNLASTSDTEAHDPISSAAPSAAPEESASESSEEPASESPGETPTEATSQSQEATPTETPSEIQEETTVQNEPPVNETPLTETPLPETPAQTTDGALREGVLEVNNVLLSVKEAGTGPDMVLIHGRTLSKESIDPLFEYYRTRYHVVSYDVRGHGQTQSSGEFTLDDLADDLAGVIAAYQMEQPVVIGFSMGSYIALRTAERYPGLLRGIVLIGTRGGRTSSPWPATDEVGRALESYDNMTAAPSVTIPALVLSGEHDAINPPEEGRKVAEALPNAEYQVVPGAEHMAYAGNPDFVFAAIDGYLGRLGAE